MTHVPQEILSMVCTQLVYQRDFDTLLNCAYSGKRLANIALLNLYRVAPTTDISCDEDWFGDHRYHGSFSDIDNQSGVSDEQRPAHERLDELSLQQKWIMSCGGFWRTIILSSLGKTLYPYSRYIRTLDFRELLELFTDQDFRLRAFKYFFQGEVAQFKAQQRDIIGGYYVLNKLETINKIGEAITKQSPQLERLIGTVFSGALSRWIPRLPRLTYLETWDDAAIRNNGNLIRRHCPLFKGLHLGNSCSPLGESVPSFVGEYDESVPALTNEHDEPVPAFVNQLRPQSLESFQWFNCHHLGSEIFQALSCHGESLTELGLNFNSKFPDFYFPNLSQLKGCTNLVSLSLARTGGYNSDLEILRLDAFRETFTWLKKCKKLRILTFNKFLKPAWIAPIFSDDTFHLTSLEYCSLEMRATEIFHQALGNQTSLQSLWLHGDLEGYTVDSDFLAESLSKLVNLKDLRLEDVSGSFYDQHIVQLAGSLPKLERWSTRASRLTDVIWDEVASLRSLRRLDLQAETDFTADGILDFIGKLGPGNKGLAFFVRHVRDRTDPWWLMEEFIQDTTAKIKEKIAKTVDGRFELSWLTYV